MKKYVESHSLLFVTVIIISLLASCSQSSVQQEENKSTILNANDELFNKGNVEFADEVFAREYAGGSNRIKDFVLARRTAFTDLQVKIDPLIAEGDMVAWIRTNSGTQTADYMGHASTDKKITWKEIIISKYDAEGKVSEEWGVTNIHEMLSDANEVDGFYEYLSPLKGQAFNRNGRFVYLFGMEDGKAPMVSQSGTQTISGDTIKNTIDFSTDPKLVGTSYFWRFKSISGDTVTYETMDEKGTVTSTGRATRVR
jgi:predicted ester cyclase